MTGIERLLCEELQIDADVLDVYVLEPDALSVLEREHIAERLMAQPVLRAYVRGLRTFYEELRDELLGEGNGEEEGEEREAQQRGPRADRAGVPLDEDPLESLRAEAWPPERVRAFIERLGGE